MRKSADVPAGILSRAHLHWDTLRSQQRSQQTTRSRRRFGGGLTIIGIRHALLLAAVMWALIIWTALSIAK